VKTLVNFVAKVTMRRKVNVKKVHPINCYERREGDGTRDIALLFV
jgi:hypothetical protein